MSIKRFFSFLILTLCTVLLLVPNAAAQTSSEEYFVALTQESVRAITPVAGKNKSFSQDEILKEAVFFSQLGVLPLKKDKGLNNVYRVRVADKQLFEHSRANFKKYFLYVEPIVETSFDFSSVTPAPADAKALSSGITEYRVASSNLSSPTLAPLRAAAAAMPSPTSSRTLPPTIPPTPTPDPCLNFPANNDSEDNNWGYSQVNGSNIRRAWCTTTGSANLVVAVLGSGINLTHPDLVENLWHDLAPSTTDLKETADGYNVYNTSVANPPNDDQGLGTYAAGIIGAKGNNGIGIAGVAWNVKLMPVRVAKRNAIFASRLDSDISKIIDGINYVIKKKSEGHNIVVVYNFLNFISDSQALSPTLQAKINEAGSHGILFVSASGDIPADLNTQVSLPSSYALSTQLTAGWYYGFNTFGQPEITYSPLSNFGTQKVHVGSAGQDIKSCWLGNGYYAPATGSSIAAGAQVAGIAVLVKSRFPRYTPAQIKAKILTTVKVIPTFADRVITSGIPDAERAVR